MFPKSTIVEAKLEKVSPLVCAIASSLAKPRAALSTVKLVVVARVETVAINSGKF